MPVSLINKELLARLERLELAFRRSQQARPDGQRVGSHHGGRIEFADYREYSPGDDFRHIDWNVLSRTDNLVVKQFEREEQYLVQLLLDTSGSMAASGDGAPSKLEYGKACLAALAYVALAAGQRVDAAMFAAGRTDWFDAGADKHRIFPLLDHLGAIAGSGATSVASALRESFERSRERCVVVLISDLLDEAPTQETLGTLAARGYDLSVIHLLSPEEINPPERGRLLLHDAESGERIPVHLTDAVVAEYRAGVDAFIDRWAAFCGKHDIRFISTATDVPFEDFIMKYLRQGGLVR